jgi:hypothetical protein
LGTAKTASGASKPWHCSGCGASVELSGCTNDAQAFFSAGRFSSPEYLLMSSSVENSFHPNSPPVQTLHHVSSLVRNVPCHLGVSFNLTGWLPARMTDWLRIKIDYTVVQDSPIKDLLDKIRGSGLTTPLSAISAEFAAAVKVSEIVGHLLSSLTGEGSKHKSFSLEVELNLATLKTGYQVVFGSQNDQSWPEVISIDNNGQLKDKRNHSLDQYSYVIIEVQGIKRCGGEMMRGRPWWELLQMAKETALTIELPNASARRAILNYWQHLLRQVQQQAREEHEFLLTEIGDVIREVHAEVMIRLQPTSHEAFGDDELPPSWQDILAVHTERELQDSVRAYQDAVFTSQQLLKQYQLTGG